MDFGQRAPDRYWWHRLPDSAYVPPIYAALSDEEWAVLDAWFHETDARTMHGEANVPALCVLQGFVMGSMIGRVVQLGAFAGYSTLLAGFMMRRMGLRHAVFSVDVDPALCDYCRHWIREADLEEHVHVECADSGDGAVPARAARYLGGAPDLVLIDSSHAYRHTRRELDLWMEALAPGGFLFLHDTSDAATQWDATREGGVHRAFEEWRREHPDVAAININGPATRPGAVLPYKDGCGLGIVQKRPPPAR